MKIYNIGDHIPDEMAKKVLIRTGDKNIIELARKDETVYGVYKELLKRDYIFYFFEDGISKLQQRKQINELWKKKDLNEHDGIYYTVTPPAKDQMNAFLPKRLLVIFTCMNTVDKQNSFLIRERMFPAFFSSISKYLVKNVYIMRIMDLNASHGSHYVNTINFPDMEEKIQSAIRYVVHKNTVSDENVILYGASKGGTGSILHGSILDYKVLAVDPIINLERYNKKDSHFLRGMREEDLSHKINATLYQNEYKRKKYIFCSPTVKFNYANAQKLNTHSHLKLREIIDPNIKSHPDVSKNTIPLQLAVLNDLFSDIC